MLKAAFNSEFVEGETQTYRLEDIGKEAFSMFVRWLYTQKLEFEDQEVSIKEAADSAQTAPMGRTTAQLKSQPRIAIQKNLATLWVLSEKLLIPRFQNLVMDTLISTWEKERCTTTCISYVYANTGDRAALRRVIVDKVAWHMKDGTFRAVQSFFPKEFYFDLAMALNALKEDAIKAGRQPHWTIDNKRYHVPEE